MGPKKTQQDEESLTLTTVHELLEQQKTFFKDLMNQQESNFKSFVKMFVDATTLWHPFGNVVNPRVDNILKDVQDIKNSLQYSQKGMDDFHKKLSDNSAALSKLSNQCLLVQPSMDKITNKSEYLESQSINQTSSLMEYSRRGMRHGKPRKLKQNNCWLRSSILTLN